MPRHRLSLPMSAWPADIARRFGQAFAKATASQRPRLEQGLGRWLLGAEREDLPPELITPALIESRSADMSPELVQSMKQALFAVFEEASIFVPEQKNPRESERAEVARLIARHLDRLPDNWRARAAPTLVVSDDGLSDGRIVESRALSIVRSILPATGAFFDFCRENGLPVELTARTLAARVDQRQRQFHDPDPKIRFSIHSMVIEATRLLTLGRDLFPERDWRWLVSFVEKMKKKAELYPTRNNQRVVPLVELRIAAIQASEVALKAHRRARGYRARLRAHTLARTALTIMMLFNSPIRVDCLAKLDLRQHFDPGLTRLHLSAGETKDKKRDVRLIPPELREALVTYIELHRPQVAPMAETALFVGRRGRRCATGYLSQRIGDLTQALFGKRVTPHVIRNIIAAFIVSEAPEEAALASEMLNHADSRTTETYRATATQITASRQLSASTEKRARAVGARNTVARKGPVRVIKRRG